MLALVVCLEGCTCGADDESVDAAGMADASFDARVTDAGLDARPTDAGDDRELDGAPDAAGIDGGLESLPECSPLYYEWAPTRALVDTPNNERTDTEYELAVVEVNDRHLRLEADPDQDPDDEPTVTIDWPTTDPRIVQPGAGDRVIMIGGVCDAGNNAGYLRLMTLDHELLWEGAEPGCTSYPGSYEWGPYLSLEPSKDEGWCKDLGSRRETFPEDECCCVSRKDMDVVLSLPGEDPVVLPADDQREVVIDGATFAVFSQGAYAILDGPCTADFTTPFGVGSAYLFRISP